LTIVIPRRILPTMTPANTTSNHTTHVAPFALAGVGAASRKPGRRATAGPAPLVLTATATARLLGIGRTTFYEHLPELRALGLRSVRLLGETRYIAESVAAIIRAAEEEQPCR
jgi:hypothetical protein